jgi:hypothetical protein
MTRLISKLLWGRYGSDIILVSGMAEEVLGAISRPRFEGAAVLHIFSN